MAVTRDNIENFLYREARLMDEHAYDEWLSLWSEEGIYWVPSNDDDADPRRAVTMVYDDRSQLEARIERLKSATAWAQDPRTRMRRLVSNIEISEVQNGQVTVLANFLINGIRRGQSDSFVGRSLYRLRLDGEELKIAMKKVMLVRNDDPIANLTFLL
jgi:3-phenylpropionate/cinnamic acid dioxygenase small subunit